MDETATNETTRELIEFLSDSATYANRPQVECIETHISHVFLAGDDVYKLKKPVKFDFLDFSTVERRREACEAEVRLNRRMASSVYLGVEAIRRNGNGHLTIGGTEKGEVVDWLVHMRRLNEDRTLTRRLRNSNAKARSSDIAKVARFLAAFYAAQAPATVKTDSFRENLRKHIEENQSQLLELAQPQAERDLVHRIHSSQLRFLVTHHDLFDSRVLDGRIVEGHGDLRPDHVYIYKSPYVIDCIEFNSDYRTNDVIDELAFLAMCCDRLGEPTLGQSLFAEYETASGDRCEPQLVAFYKSYRACVRAKVAGLRGQQQTHSKASDLLQKEHDYLDLADRYVPSLDRPFVLMVGGLMGSGKSTLAGELKQLLSTEIVSSDAVRTSNSKFCDDRVETDGNAQYGTGKYSPSTRLTNYQRMIEIAESLVNRNYGIIFDATFTMRSARELVADFARDHGCQILQVECECPREEAIARITERAEQGKTQSEAYPEHYDQQVAEADPPLHGHPIVHVDTTLALAEVQSVVLKTLVPLIARERLGLP